MLELKQIKKSYQVGENKQLVLKGIDIKFRRNEFTSILGSSGSGKTTLLNIIGGLDKYDSGDLIIEGVSTKEYKDRDWDSYRNYRVGFIFQSYNLIMHQSVLQNVEMALTLSGAKPEERKAKAIEALKKVGLGDHINKKPNQLSGGQMQRVAIARALVNDPEIILADEPTGALDSKTSVQIMDLLKEIANDKLVIMVTHNPELAKKYSTRIIELKDGLIIKDSKPFDGKNEFDSKRSMNKTSMSLLSAMQLSFNNLKTKIGRTALTAIAGSIGIIGIALILSLSNGVNNMAKDLERNSMSDYPITIEKNSYDIFASLASLSDGSLNKKCDENKICSSDDIVKEVTNSTTKGTLTKNNVKEFIKYIESHEEFKNNSTEITYDYNLTLNLYTADYKKANPVKYTDTETTVVSLLPTNTSNYKILAGQMPKEKNELLIVVGENRMIKDSILYSLGIKDRNQLNKDFESKKNNSKFNVKSTKYSYDSLLNKTVKLILNTDKYKEENGIFIDYSSNSSYMKEKIDNGLELKVVGVALNKGASTSTIGYRKDLVNYVIDEIAKTDIYAKQISNKEINVLTGTEFDGFIDTYDSVTEQLGIFEKDNPSSVSIYPKDYDSKEKLVELISTYNENNKANGKEDLVISYTDMMKSLVGGLTSIVNVISIVLIGFVAISLLVSSIMIAIITYISVLERTKEIGILRAIGASKRDVKRVFFAETIIEGLIAGILGVGVAFILTIVINFIVGALSPNTGNIASMPITGAIALVLLSVLLNVIAGAKPAGMAAKKDPVESLRTE